MKKSQQLLAAAPDHQDFQAMAYEDGIENGEQDPKGKGSRLFQEIQLQKYNRHRKIVEQIKVYLITYLAYSIIHFEKEFWSFSKAYITKQHPNELSKQILSRFDTAQLFCYGISLYVCGIIGDNYNQVKVLTIGFTGMCLLYLMLALVGFYDITGQAYFYVILSFIGIFNAFLLPCFISINGRWFPKKTRGFIVGLWATCNNFGNIVGIQAAAFLLDIVNGKWQWLMVVASALALCFALAIFFFLHPTPEEIGIQIEELTEKEILIASAVDDQQVYDNIIKGSIAGEPREKILQEVQQSLQYGQIKNSIINPNNERQISFFKAWLLPGVVLYSFSFFCTKMAVYQLLLWLPTFLKQSELAYNDQQVANLINMLDIGAIFGSMTLGYLSDLMYGKRSPVALGAVMMASLISFTLKVFILDLSKPILFILMFFLGFFISGLNNLISSACAADLGRQEALKGNEKATSTVTGIIDGTGTLGSAVGQYIIGVTQRKWGWYNGYLLVIAIDISVTALPILKIAFDELKQLKKIRQVKKAMDI